ncbi:MAG: two-component system response regulator [Clostridia bacterium]|jgi:PleD family two-component response regulator|nr:two-component system response regulator [Clostridia bacterium]
MAEEVNKMKFSRSFFGYSPIEVERKVNELLEKYASEEKTFSTLLENANKEYTKLTLQHNLLSSNLTCPGDSALYLYNKEIFNNTLDHTERSAIVKVEEIAEDQENFIKTINKTIEEIDSLLLILRQEFSEMTSALDKVIESIMRSKEVDEQAITSFDTIIDNLSYRVSNYKPFKALEFDTHLSKIEKSSMPESKELKELKDSKIEALPFAPYVVPVKSNNITNLPVRPNRPQTVLIAENDFEISSLLSYVLEREGFNIILAADAHILMDMLKEKDAPDIIILDTLLPYMQANMIIKEIKASKAWDNVPILITTSEHNKQVTIEALECGANDSIEKPFNPRELVARVKRLNQSASKTTLKVGG